VKARKLSTRLVRAILHAVAVVALVLAWSRPATAYPWMIRHEYTACAQCHADPSGGALLTMYGRAQSEILLRTYYGHRGDDYEPSRVNEFAFGLFKLPDELLLGGDVRTLYLNVKPEGGPAISRYIWMQADVQGQVTIDRFRANGSIGYAHEGARAAAITNWADHNVVSRTHWVGVDLGADRQWLLRAGRMNLPFGLRNIEHTTWVRSRTRTSTNDHQQHGLALAYTAGKWRGEAMAIAGNFQLSPNAYRDRGYSAYAEYAFTSKLALGASSNIVHAEQDLLLGTAAWRHAHGAFARWASPWKPLVVLAEGDYVLWSQRTRNSGGVAAMVQLDIEPIQGVHGMVTGELLNERFGATTSSYGVWASAAWFFAPHLDVRLDAIQQQMAAGDTTLGVRSLLAQFHAFL
jgi:hypothetical protein